MDVNSIINSEVKRARGKIEPGVKDTDFRVEFGLHYSAPTRRETRG